jgi:hypothetical protein
MLFTFDNAWAGDEKEITAADVDITDLEFSFQFVSPQKAFDHEGHEGPPRNCLVKLRVLRG